jgi:anti-sigma B factor antagonist
MQLQLTAQLIDTVLVLDCSGRLVSGEESDFFRHFMHGLLDVKAIVLNLAALSYMDSGGLGSLVGAYSSARMRDGHIKLAGLPPNTRDVLRVTKLLGVLEVYDTVEAAVRDFRKAAVA